VYCFDSGVVGVWASEYSAAMRIIRHGIQPGDSR